MKPYSITTGHRYPAGATAAADGVNFCIFSRHATAVSLLLYEKPDSDSPFQIIDLDPTLNRTFFFWHVYVEGMSGEEKISYTWKVDGPDNDDPGHRFDPSVELLDPWAKAVTDVMWEFCPILLYANYQHDETSFFKYYGMQEAEWVVFPYEDTEKVVIGDRGLHRDGTDSYGKEENEITIEVSPRC